MVGSAGTLVSLHSISTKLRKRDDSSSVGQLLYIQTTSQASNRSDTSHDGVVTLTERSHIQTLQEVTFVRLSGSHPVPENDWVFPPKAPTPQIYNCLKKTTLSHSENNGIKGFRKQFSGRFKRFVSKKPDEVPAIPPELKPQLKTIYVY